MIRSEQSICLAGDFEGLDGNAAAGARLPNTKTPLRILLLEDNVVDAELTQTLLRREGLVFEIERVMAEDQFQGALSKGTFDIIISDFTLPSYDGMKALSFAQQRLPDTPFVFFSGTIGEDLAVESLKGGATDYVLKHRSERLGRAIRRAMQEVEDRRLRHQAEQALWQRERWFHAITDNSLDIVTILEANGRMKYNSLAVERVLGFSPDELSGLSFVEFLHADDARLVETALTQALQGPGQTVRLNFRFRQKQGGWRYLEAIGQNQLEDPAIHGIVINSRDMTDRQLAENKYRLIFDNAIEGICQTTLEGRFVTVNASLATMLGYSSAQELLSSISNVAQLYAKQEDRNELIRRINQGEIVRGFEVQLMRKDGVKIWISLNSQAIRDSNGTARLLDNTIEDISDRRRATEKIRQQAALLDAASDAIFVADLDRHIRYWSKGAERLYGWGDQEVLGKRPGDLFSRLDPFDSAEARRVLFQKSEWDGELTQHNKRGQEIIVISRWTLLRDAEGNAQSVLVINTDITERKKAEAQYLRAQRMECLGALAGGIAHDLNNVLAPTMMMTELLSNEVLSDNAKEMLAIVRASAQRGAEMVKQILSFARGVGGGPEPLELKHLISEIAKLLRQTFPQSIEIRTRTAPGIPSILGQATQLHQVLMNLAVNARDAMPEGGILSIETTLVSLSNRRTPMLAEPVSGEYVLLKVTDSGVGIPAHLQERIFEPFFTTKAEGVGTGLGLATVLGIIRNHNGFIELKSSPAKGATFQIYLPALPRRSETSDAPPRVARAGGQGQVVLLVDDETAILELTKLLLETKGYRVLTAQNGQEGYELFEKHRDEIQLVISDLLMPVMDGAAFVKKLRSNGFQTKVIFVSGIDSRAKIPDADKLDVQGFLGKPYAGEKLIQLVDELVFAPAALS